MTQAIKHTAGLGTKETTVAEAENKKNKQSFNFCNATHSKGVECSNISQALKSEFNYISQEKKLPGSFLTETRQFTWEKNLISVEWIHPEWILSRGDEGTAFYKRTDF